MKLKKINKNNEYVVNLSQTEVNAINELLCNINIWNSEHEVARETYKELLEFFNEHSTMEFEDIFHPIMDVDGQTFLLEYPVELHLKKDLLKV